MKAPWELRAELHLIDRGTAITRDEFDRTFSKTNETIEFSFYGWDGKSYDGETRRAKIYRTSLPGFEDMRFIKVGKGLHYVEEDHDVVEKATGLTHKGVSWLVDVLQKTKG